MFQIVHREEFSETAFLWDVFAPDMAKAAKPGQFVMLRLKEHGERIPLTVADFDRERGTITMVIQALGRTTREMMRNYSEGDWFSDFVGPLGVESHIEKLDHVVLVGGGLGVAPVFPQLRAYKEAGCKVTGIIGFRSEQHVFWEDKFAQYCDELIVCTDDGSYGKPGFVTVALQEVIERETAPDRVVAIGPLPMMRACAEVTRPAAIPTMVSLNAIMVDGTGMCGSCRVTVDGKVRFACVEGPDFEAHGIDFEELMQRQKRFKGHESEANDDYDHVCQLEDTLVKAGKRNYKKFKNLPPKATPMRERDAEERAANFKEVNLGYSIEEAMTEAERCIQCKKPLCVAGCPVNIDIPGFIRQILVRDIDGARDVIAESNLFPSICGRVCPQESQCEAVCILAKKMDPVAIGRLERFVGDNASPARATERTVAEDRKKVAVVGSGPAGLACAADMAKDGADVTVYEALHVVGGVLQYGIPSFRLPRETIAREVDGLKKMGVKFEVDRVIGKVFTLEQLMQDKGYDSVFVGTGAGYPVFLGIPGESAGQVYSANEFLTRVNLMGGDKFPFDDTPVAIGEKVVVIGAGNTAMDCLRVSKRIGAREVNCVYRRTEAEAPCRIEELRHAKEEGIQFNFLRSPREIVVDDDGTITSMICDVMELGEPDASGRRRPIKVEGESQVIECDTVIFALGTRANPIIGQSAPDLELNKWGYIVADEAAQATSIPGVFAGGDIVTGGATVILAMGAGRRAAAGMKDWMARGEWPPTVEALGSSVQTDEGALCPRCKQPVDDDQSYICCAGETIEWRCTGCGKVSEGFAFPYGLCPSCGGTLEKTGASAVAGATAHEAIREAFQIELGGMALYSQGAKETQDEDLKKLFLELADMERHHVHILSHRYHVQPLEESDGVGPAALAVYSGVEGTPKTAVELLELAVVLEKKARDFFTARAAALEPDSPEWMLYRELEAEEYEHVAMVSTELERFRAGKSGLLGSTAL